MTTRRFLPCSMIVDHAPLRDGTGFNITASLHLQSLGVTFAVQQTMRPLQPLPPEAIEKEVLAHAHKAIGDTLMAIIQRAGVADPSPLAAPIPAASQAPDASAQLILDLRKELDDLRERYDREFLRTVGATP